MNEADKQVDRNQLIQASRQTLTITLPHWWR